MGDGFFNFWFCNKSDKYGDWLCSEGFIVTKICKDHLATHHRRVSPVGDIVQSACVSRVRENVPGSSQPPPALSRPLSAGLAL